MSATHTGTGPDTQSSGTGARAAARRLRRNESAITVLTGLASLVFAIVAGVWTFAPSTNAFADPDSWIAGDTSLLGSVLSPSAAARTLLALSVAGVAVAAVSASARHRSIRKAHALVGGFGVTFALVVGIGMLSETAIMTAGYLMAVAVAVGVVVFGVQIVRTSPVGRWVVALVAGAVVAALTTGVIPMSTVRGLAELVVDMFAESAAIVGVLGLVVTVVLWVLTAGLALRETAVVEGVVERAGDWVLRHRRAITIVAAMGPVPYALIRLTWLTPWPQLTVESLALDMRVWGMMLSAGAWAGMILTIGLIRPWGEIFPRWMPRMAGRPVPVWAAAGPGAVVAAVLIVSAVPMIRMFAEQSLADAVESALIFPLWLWGPALSLAVWGYVLHRRRG